jgi:Uncharacterized low-complexity proteins
MGLRFETCNPFGFRVEFQHCVLDHASFYKCKLKNTRFDACLLQEADFSECDATGAVFAECELLNAKFEHSVLEKTDFRTARNYTIDPRINRLRKAKFSMPAATGLLECFGVEID